MPYKIRSMIDDSSASSYDILPIVCMFVLLFMGITAIYSAHSHTGGLQWIVQIVWALVGAGVYYIVSRINYSFWEKNAHIIYFGSVVLLLLLWTPFGCRKYGALRWVKLFGIAVQPSEFAKLGFILMLGAMMAREEVTSFGNSIKNLAKYFFACCIPAILVLLQPDLGSALTFPVIFFSMLYVSNLSRRFFVYVAVVALMLLIAVVIDIFGYRNFLDSKLLGTRSTQEKYETISLLPLKDYQRDRIMSFICPEVIDPNGIGVSWNLRQSLIAVGTGGIVGKGFNNGTQAKLGYLPESISSNDFIFSVLAEERGFVGSLVVVISYVLLIWRGLRTSLRSRDRFGTYLCVGTSMLLLLHVCVNIGMTIGLMPITGIPLSFLSYGGSFLLVCCFLQGIIQSVHRYRKCSI